MAVISGFTLMAPEAMSSIARGYSPAEAQEPCRRIWRETTFWRGRVTVGGVVPTRATGAALRGGSMAAGEVLVGAAPSRGTSAPLLLVGWGNCGWRASFG